MRGPSSSHCAAALRIGRLARDLMGGELDRLLVEFHPRGSLATTHRTQGSDMGLFGGLLGWDAPDPRLLESEKALKEAGISAEIRITDFQASHPNTYRMTLWGGSAHHRLTAISTGGGIIEVLDVDGLSLSLAGDAFETLLWVDPERTDVIRTHPALRKLEEEVESIQAISGGGEAAEGGNVSIIRIRSPRRLTGEEVEDLRGLEGVGEVRSLLPVLPVLTPPGVKVPFLSARTMLEYNDGRGLGLWKLAVEYEAVRGGVSREEVILRMEEIVGILEESARQGIAGTEYDDRILGPQAPGFQRELAAGTLLDGGILNHIILHVTALMEVKSAMGVIVAAPTAGSCGAVPGACLGAGAAMGLDSAALARGLLAAGMVGVFIAAHSTFAAEVCGCQAECGAGSGMAAAALVTLAGGTTEQALAAASMALQSTLGMICDPVANRVEVPCLGRNVLAASNALAAANMAMAGFDPVVPLDEVIETMDVVGKSLPRELRCTALGGLSVGPTSRRIAEELDGGS